MIDEAHSAVSPAYTTIWTGLAWAGTRTVCPSSDCRQRRSGDEQVETERLVKRFGGHRFDDFESDPYPMLQDMGVLSNVRHVVLSGSNVELTPKELEHFKRTRPCPRRWNESELMLSAIRRFSTDRRPARGCNRVAVRNVGCARRALAGLLSSGIPRRRCRAGPSVRAGIERFRAGEIRIDELRRIHRGFRCSRREGGLLPGATYSPNLYQQMIGRGSRPLNGGRMFHRQCEGQPCGVRRAACVHRVRVPLERGVVMLA